MIGRVVGVGGLEGTDSERAPARVRGLIYFNKLSDIFQNEISEHTVM